MPTCIIPLKEYFILTFRFERWIFRFGHYSSMLFFGKYPFCHTPYKPIKEQISQK